MHLLGKIRLNGLGNRARVHSIYNGAQVIDPHESAPLPALQV